MHPRRILVLAFEGIAVLSLSASCSREAGEGAGGALGLDPPPITIGSDGDMSGNAFGRDVSARFGITELRKLYERMNSPAFRERVAKYSCAKPLPAFEISVQLWREGPYQERQVRMQMSPRLYQEDGCLEEGMAFLFHHAVKDLDTGEPIDYGYRDPMTGAKLDTKRFAAWLPPEPACQCGQPQVKQ